MARPPKKPEDRQETSIRIPMTTAEKTIIMEGADAANEKPIPWARETLLRAAKRRRPK